METNTITQEKQEKLCRGCNLVRPIREFHKDRTRGDGYKAQCASCREKKRDKRITERKDSRDVVAIEEKKKAEARRIALKRLVQMHEREFVQMATEEYRRMNIPAKWHNLSETA